MTLKAKRPTPTSKTIEASAASGVKENAPPVSASAEALLLALALAVALAVAVAVALALDMALCMALADASGQAPSGSKAVSGSVPKSTLPPGLK
jgi:hypothetical protein